MVQCKSVKEERAQASSSGSSNDSILEVESSAANKISEDVLNCLFIIFLRLSTPKRKTMKSGILSSFLSLDFCEDNCETELKDPYGICSNSRPREVGPYRNLYAIEACTIDLKRKAKASFLIQRLKYVSRLITYILYQQYKSYAFLIFTFTGSSFAS